MIARDVGAFVQHPPVSAPLAALETAVWARSGKQEGPEVRFLCPVHDDHRPSARWHPEKKTWHCDVCKTGGGWVDLSRRLGLQSTTTNTGRIVATYDYKAEDGRLLFQAVRLEPKDFRQRKPDGAGGWVWKLGNVRRVLYRLPELLAADRSLPIFIVEGEKDADRLWSLGLPATTNVGGAGKWHASYSEALRGRQVVVIADNDDPGLQHAEQVARALYGHARSVGILTPPGVPAKGDISDWLNQHGDDAAALLDLAEQARPWTPDATGGVNAVSAVSTQEPPLPFSVQALPPVARALVVEGAASLQCPPDLVAVPLLAMAAGVIGNRHAVELKPGYTQRPILWAAVIASTGTAKTPAMSLTQSCLDTLQKEAHERRLQAKEQYQYLLDTWQSQDKSARGERPAAPKDEEHYYTTESTLEGIAKMLGAEASSTPGFCIVRDELAGWVLSFDAYRAKGGDRQTFLSLWAGAAFKSDRAGRDTVYVPHPAVSVCGGIQPEMLPALATETGSKDGFTERILFAYPDTAPMRWTEDYVSEATRGALTEAFRQLRKAPGSVVRLSPDAKRAYVFWVNENAEEQEHTSGVIRGYYAKLPNQCARLALILHCLTYPDAPGAHLVSGATMAAAIDLTEYFRAHAHRAFSCLGTEVRVSHPLSVRVLRHLRQQGDWVSLTDLRRALGGHVRAELLGAALDECARTGTAESRELPTDPERGGRPRTEWRLCVRTVETVITPLPEVEDAVWTA